MLFKQTALLFVCLHLIAANAEPEPTHSSFHQSEADAVHQAVHSNSIPLGASCGPRGHKRGLQALINPNENFTMTYNIGIADVFDDGSLLIRSSDPVRNRTYDWAWLQAGIISELDYVCGGSYTGLSHDKTKLLQKLFCKKEANRFGLASYDLLDLSLFDLCSFQALGKAMAGDALDLRSVPAKSMLPYKSIRVNKSSLLGPDEALPHSAELWFQDLSSICGYNGGYNWPCIYKAWFTVEPLALQVAHALRSKNKRRPLIVIAHCKHGLDRTGGLMISYQEQVYKQTFECAYLNQQMFSTDYMRSMVVQQKKIYVPVENGVDISYTVCQAPAMKPRWFPKTCACLSCPELDSNNLKLSNGTLFQGICSGSCYN